MCMCARVRVCACVRVCARVRVCQTPLHFSPVASVLRIFMGNGCCIFIH